MGKSRRQDTRAENSDRDLIQKLKSMVRSQQKVIAQLRRELGKRHDVSEDLKEVLEESTREQELAQAEAARTESSKPKPVCPKCGQPIQEIPIGKFILERCTKCNWRTRRK